MKPENINPGETYNIRVKVEHIDEDGWIKVRTSEKAISFILSPKEQDAFSPLPKYDPCRPFRKGDIVEPCLVNGRCLSPEWEHRTGIRYEVVKDEDPLTAYLEAKDPDSPQPFFVHAAFLKLITPVEELGPYSIAGNLHGWIVYKDLPGNVVANFNHCHPNAKAAAEAERDHLNAEYRKEMDK